MGRAYEVRKASMEKTGKAKAKLYSLYAKEILQAAKGNPDPVSNDVLRRLIEKAKREQVPTDIINRNIEKVKKGVTEDYVSCEYEAYGPLGSNLIIKCFTDNTNRSISEIKTVFNKTGIKMASVGSVSYLYDTFSVIGIKDKNEEEVMEALFEDGIEINDIEVDNDVIVIYGNPNDFNNIKSSLEKKYGEIKFEIDEITKFAKDKIKLSDSDAEIFNKALSMFEDIDDVSNVYHNVEL